MPTVIGGGGTGFYVYHDNTIDISITLKNLIDGIDPSDMEIALKYRTLFEDDIQWLIDNKLNKTN